MMKNPKNFIRGALAGVGLMYLFDPDQGPRRRALLRDKSVHVQHRIADRLRGIAQDVRNRSMGAAAELRSWLRHDDVSDGVLHDRVRQALGRAISHPELLVVEVADDGVRLRGSVLEQELDRLLRAVGRVRGIREVRNELQVYREPGANPSCQGTAGNDKDVADR
jgi:BON domain